MKNKDILNSGQQAVVEQITAAAKSGNMKGFEEGFRNMFKSIHDDMLREAALTISDRDAAILGRRGSLSRLRVLNRDEITFYKNVIDAMRKGFTGEGTKNPLMALPNIEKTLPLTVINKTLEDMVQEHELLEAVDTVAAPGLMRYLTNTDTGDNATWGELESEIVKEVASGIKEVDLEQCKLSAWIPISQDMIELGPIWLDAYIRTCLSEALSIGFEKAIVTGTGKNMPIGMDRDVSDDVTVTGGVYPQKEAVAVTDFETATYGGLVSQLAVTQYGKPRKVSGLILICHPNDYFAKIMPATTLVTQDGRHVDNVLPVPTQIIQSVAVTQGEAILGLGKKYFLGIGGRRGVQFSDDYKFLEDQRYYKIVAYANGRPKDNNAFLRLDISNVEPMAYRVKTISATP